MSVDYHTSAYVAIPLTEPIEEIIFTKSPGEVTCGTAGHTAGQVGKFCSECGNKFHVSEQRTVKRPWDKILKEQGIDPDKKLSVYEMFEDLYILGVNVSLVPLDPSTSSLQCGTQWGIGVRVARAGGGSRTPSNQVTQKKLEEIFHDLERVRKYLGLPNEPILSLELYASV